MHLSHMFPSKTLNGQDFVAALGPATHILTIEGITEKVFEQSRSGELEVAFYVKFRQFKKPIKLNQSNAWAIADAVGSQDSDEWIGKNIQICAYSKSIVENTGGRPTKKVIWVFDIIAEPPTQPPVALVGQDITGHAEQVRKGLAQPGHLLRSLPAAGAPTPPPQDLGTLGIDTALKIANELHIRNRTIEDAAKYLGTAAPQIAQAITGKLLPFWPSAAKAWVWQMCRDLPPINQTMNTHALEQLRASWTPSEVIDPKTGEVLNQPPVDDIPF